jgi:hypothetical protein
MTQGRIETFDGGVGFRRNRRSHTGRDRRGRRSACGSSGRAPATRRGEQHLHRVLTLYSLYYNETRRAVQRSGPIVATPILSGLHHTYARICFSGGTRISASSEARDRKNPISPQPDQPAELVHRAEDSADSLPRANSIKFATGTADRTVSSTC